MKIPNNLCSAPLSDIHLFDQHSQLLHFPVLACPRTLSQPIAFTRCLHGERKLPHLLLDLLKMPLHLQGQRRRAGVDSTVYPTVADG